MSPNDFYQVKRWPFVCITVVYDHTIRKEERVQIEESVNFINAKSSLHIRVKNETAMCAVDWSKQVLVIDIIIT